MTNEKNAPGIVLMLFSMVAFALADTLVKYATAFASPAQVLFYLVAGALIVFFIMAKMQGEVVLDTRAFQPILLVRYLSEVIGMVGMVMALAQVPLSMVGAITQAAPILVAVGAVLFLGEKVSWRRWSSIAIGFIGVVLIIQPGTEGFELPVLWAILAMVALSVRDLTTRMAPSDMASSVLATLTMAAAIPFTIIWVMLRGESLFPVGVNWWVILLMTGLGALGYMLLIMSLRLADMSVVTPFRYSRIIFLLILGILLFDERPNALMLLGAALVILSGVYLMWRERQLKRLASNHPPDTFS